MKMGREKTAMTSQCAQTTITRGLSYTTSSSPLLLLLLSTTVLGGFVLLCETSNQTQIVTLSLI